MLNSFYSTKSDFTDLVIYVSEEDAKLQQYFELLEKYPCVFLVGKRLYLAHAYNHLVKLFPYHKWFAPVNDDHYFITPQWDLRLIDIINAQGYGWGIAAAEDKLTDWEVWQHPSGCVVSANIVKTLGYLIWPKIQHIGIDDYFQFLLQGINHLFHTEEVIIEHRHWLNGKSFLDDNYKWVYGQEQQIYGRNAIDEYLRTQLKNDIAKLKEAMRKEGITI